MVKKSKIRRLAESQGVVRPFEALVRMPAESRQRIAKTLGCWLPYRGGAEAEAWRIINQNLMGLQARTHTVVEQLTPFSRNNNWREIITRTARWCGIRINPRQRDTELERELFERLADQFVQHLPAHERFALDSLAKSTPEVDQAMRTLSLSTNGMRTVLSAIVVATVKADEGIRDGALKVRDWMREGCKWSWRVSIGTGLRLLNQRMNDVIDSWASKGYWDKIGGKSSKVCAAVAAIYLHELMIRTLDEVETAGI